jgi:hypothetical protein
MWCVRCKAGATSCALWAAQVHSDCYKPELHSTALQSWCCHVTPVGFSGLHGSTVPGALLTPSPAWYSTTHLQGKFQLVLLPQAGHAIQEDQAPATASHLASFLSRFRIGEPPMVLPRPPVGTQPVLPVVAGPIHKP